MTLNRIYITLAGLIICMTSFGQTTELRKIDNELTGIYKSLIKADYQLRNDSIAPLFKERLSEQLLNPTSFVNPLDSLSRYLTIKTSSDKKIKFYSWDALGGGTWHNINCLAQFKSNNGKIIIQQLNSDKEAESGEFTDSEIYEVNELTIGKTKFYLTFAWGTHGSGYQHQIIQIFTISRDKLVKCKSCFQGNNDLVIEYPRSAKANLTFNSPTNEISYKEFKLNNEIEFYEPTGEVITLRLTKGIFTKK
jgi:hypothetical protein